MIVRAITASFLIIASLGSCAMQHGDAVSASEQVAGQISVTGNLFYRERIALPPDGIVHVVLNDISLADAPSRVIARQDIKLTGQQVPIAFALAVDAVKLEPRHRYSVRATIEDSDGGLLWTTDTVHIVEPGTADQDLGPLMLVRVVAPADKPADAPSLVGGE